MNLRTYQALSLNEALTRIRSDLGENAVILHSRTFRRGGLMGLGGQLVYEVTASPPAPQPRRIMEAAAAPAAMRVKEPAGVSAAVPPSESASPRAAAIALALAEQERRRRTQKGRAVEASASEIVAPVAAAPAIAARRQDAATSPPPPSSPLPSFAQPAAPAAGYYPGLDPPVPSLKPQAPGPKSQRPAATLPSPAAAPRVAASPPARSSKGRSRKKDERSANAAPPLPVARRFVLSPEPRLPEAPAQPITAGVAASSEAKGEPACLTAANVEAPAPPDPGLRHEIAALKQMVGQVLQRQSGTLQGAMPEALFNEYLSLIQSEVAQEIADELCAAVRAELSEAELNDPHRVRASFRRRLAQHVPVAPDSMLAATADGRPFTLALVGPTGVGKTTTVAKLAASFKLRHHRRVGLITTDTYRIAAVDQLRTYANIIGIPLKVALTPQEMREACESLRHSEVILIDTAGRSPNDAARLEEIRDFTQAADPHEVHLVLSSTYSEAALMRTIERFSAVKTDRVIFTKTDEAVSLGVLINVMRKAGKELSFITTGQEVPDHIEPGNPDRLASLVLGEKGQE